MSCSIEKAVELILGTLVTSPAMRMARGEVHEVYKVETDGRAVAVKVFRRATWPEDNKPQWIEEQLSRFGVPRAKLLYHSREAIFFPRGLMISEYVEGQNALDAITDGTLSAEEYCSQVGLLLRQVHRIPVHRYGYLCNGQGMYATLAEHKLTHEVKERLLEEGTRVFAESLYGMVERKVKEQLAPFEGRFSPVLAHDDVVPKNAIWSKDRGLILVDWDAAIMPATVCASGSLL